MRYRSLRVCSLREWSPQVHAGFLVSGATQALPQTASSFSYRALTVCGGAFQAPSDRSDAKSLWRMTVRPGQAYNPRAATPVSLTRHEFRRPPVRSPLLRGCFLFLGVREMFQFPRFPPRQCRGHRRSDGVAPFGDRGLNACSRLPHAYRRNATSFIGTQRRGIHQLLIVSSLAEHSTRNAFVSRSVQSIDVSMHIGKVQPKRRTPNDQR